MLWRLTVALSRRVFSCGFFCKFVFYFFLACPKRHHVDIVKSGSRKSAMSALYDYQLEGLGGYQEFDRYPGEETVYVDCPTCRGKGRINMNSEKNQLISLGEPHKN